MTKRIYILKIKNEIKGLLITDELFAGNALCMEKV